jgi:hypothetical protein
MPAYIHAEASVGRSHGVPEVGTVEGHMSDGGFTIKVGSASPRHAVAREVTTVTTKGVARLRFLRFMERHSSTQYASAEVLFSMVFVVAQC